MMDNPAWCALLILDMAVLLGFAVGWIARGW